MSGVKNDNLNGSDAQRKCRVPMHPWSLLRTNRGSLRLAFFGVPSHWHQDNVAEKPKEENEKSVRPAKP